MDADVVRDLLGDVGPIGIRRMFGGLGIFSDGLMFALVSDGELYIKADSESVLLFSKAGSGEFTYTKSSGKVFRLGYWRLPDLALDDPSEAAFWARHGIQAAQRAARAKAVKSHTGKKDKR